jgi:Transposase DDE domain
MDKCINFSAFMRYLFDDTKMEQQGSKIIRALLEAQSPRLSNIAEKMRGNSASCYKSIQRFLQKVDMKQVLLRFYHPEAGFVIGDPTEMERSRARKTAYVGTLSDGMTPGYWLLMLSMPFRGRAIPFSFVLYSSRTIAEQVTSRNQEHFRCFEQVKGLLGDRPLVLDREFSYHELMEILTLEHIQFVIRLNEGHGVRIVDEDGKPVKLLIHPGDTIIRLNVYYLGKVKVNLIGYLHKGLSKPLWVITTLKPEEGLEIYQQRMKIEETFRDCKDLLHLPKLMNKRQHHLEQMIALTLIAYNLGLWFGEALRDVTYGHIKPSQVQQCLLGKLKVDLKKYPKWAIYSGLFVLLKQKLRISKNELRLITHEAEKAFAILIFGNVRTCVRT